MKTKYFAIVGLAIVPLLAWAAVMRPGQSEAQPAGTPVSPFVTVVRTATERFKNVEVAKADGYGLLHGCVSGQQGGAMGVHFANGGIVGDGEVDATRPEALMYELRNGQYELVGVEYVVIAADWDAKHEAPPVLMGQLFNFVSSPNRYGLPAFYELHVWAGRDNPWGTFADWNPNVACDEFAPAEAMHEGHH